MYLFLDMLTASNLALSLFTFSTILRTFYFRWMLKCWSSLFSFHFFFFFLVQTLFNIAFIHNLLYSAVYRFPMTQNLSTQAFGTEIGTEYWISNEKFGAAVSYVEKYFHFSRDMLSLRKEHCLQPLTPSQGKPRGCSCIHGDRAQAELSVRERDFF